MNLKTKERVLIYLNFILFFTLVMVLLSFFYVSNAWNLTGFAVNDIKVQTRSFDDYNNEIVRDNLKKVVVGKKKIQEDQIEQEVDEFVDAAREAVISQIRLEEELSLKVDEVTEGLEVKIKENAVLFGSNEDVIDKDLDKANDELDNEISLVLTESRDLESVIEDLHGAVDNYGREIEKITGSDKEDINRFSDTLRDELGRVIMESGGVERIVDLKQADRKVQDAAREISSQKVNEGVVVRKVIVVATSTIDSYKNILLEAKGIRETIDEGKKQDIKAINSELAEEIAVLTTEIDENSKLALSENVDEYFHELETIGGEVTQVQKSLEQASREFNEGLLEILNDGEKALLEDIGRLTYENEKDIFDVIKKSEESFEKQVETDAERVEDELKVTVYRNVISNDLEEEVESVTYSPPVLYTEDQLKSLFGDSCLATEKCILFDKTCRTSGVDGFNLRSIGSESDDVIRGTQILSCTNDCEESYKKISPCEFERVSVVKKTVSLSPDGDELNIVDILSNNRKRVTVRKVVKPTGKSLVDVIFPA